MHGHLANAWEPLVSSWPSSHATWQKRRLHWPRKPQRHCPLVALTTVQALVDLAKARKGQSILIHAGSGGLGSFVNVMGPSHRAFARQFGANLCHVVHRSSNATARPSSWWSLLPLPHGVQRNTVGTRWSRGRCWKGMNRGRKNLSIRSGRRSFAVRGDGSCKGETRHSVIDMNVRRMKGKILPACRFYGEGNC
jgi:hypothetical protein